MPRETTTEARARAADFGPTWSIWFGNIDQPDLGDALASRIPDSPEAGG